MGLKLILFPVLIGLLLLSGCTILPDSPICGNGICENPQETSGNCSVDEGSDCPPLVEEKTCTELGGFACTENQSCEGEFLNASDGPVCCSMECIKPIPEQVCGNGIMEGYEECDLSGCDSFETCSSSCECVEMEEYSVSVGNNIETSTGFSFKLDAFDSTSGDESITYSILDSAGKIVPGWSGVFAPINLSGVEALKIYAGEYPIRDGVIRYVINNVNPPLLKLNLESCLRSTIHRAKGVRKILFVPAYFKDVQSELKNHSQRLKMYEDSFDEIGVFLKVKQDKFIGEQKLFFEFTISEPILLSNPSADYYDSDLLDGLEKNRQVYSEIRENTDFEPLDFDVIVFRMYSETQSTRRSHSENHVAYLSPRPPELLPDLENPDLIHLLRNSYTLEMFHEILHQFSFTDAFERPGTNYRNEYYLDEKFDGAQELFDGYPPADAGGFQAIDDFIAQELGWSDRNDNGILDLEEYCEIGIAS